MDPEYIRSFCSNLVSFDWKIWSVAIGDTIFIMFSTRLWLTHISRAEEFTVEVSRNMDELYFMAMTPVYRYLSTEVLSGVAGV
jgi:hypothetical protein